MLQLLNLMQNLYTNLQFTINTTILQILLFFKKSANCGDDVF